MEKVYSYLKKAKTFYIATVEGDQPRVRPFGAICKFENKLYIITNNKKKVYDQIIKNPKVEISGMVEGTWIRLAGTLALDERREAKEAMLAENPSLSGMYSVDDGIMAVFYFTSGEAQFCSFTGAPEVENF